MLICCSKNISDYYQCWKTVVLLHSFVETDKKKSGWIESSKEQRLFEIEIFCNIINVFNVTFDKLNASFLNKSINLILILK